MRSRLPKFPLAKGERRAWNIEPVTPEVAAAVAILCGDYNAIHRDHEAAVALCCDRGIEPLPDGGHVIISGGQIVGIVSGKFVDLLGDGTTSARIGGKRLVGGREANIFFDIERPAFTGQYLHLSVMLTRAVESPVHRCWLAEFDMSLEMDGELIIETVATVAKFYLPTVQSIVRPETIHVAA
jgi:acyl dehydratase